MQSQILSKYRLLILIYQQIKIYYLFKENIMTIKITFKFF